MTEPSAPPPAPVPSQAPESEPDEPGFDDPRNIIARDKGLPGDVITGGDDPNPAKGLAEERYYGRLLLIMVVVIIATGFVVGTLIALATTS